MKRLGFVSISAMLVVFFALSPVFATSGSQTAPMGDALGDNGDEVSCPPPQVLSYDSTIYLCNLEEVCFDVVGVNSGGDLLVISQVEGPGQFQMLTDTSGQTCFMPYEVDSATYLFAYTVERSGDAASPPCCDRDTIRITVVLNQPPEIACPGSQMFYACEPDTFCFTVDATDPEQGPLTFNVLSGNATIEDRTVCVYSEESAEFDVVIEVVDSCDLTDTCVVLVFIEVNNPPYVSMADDFSVFMCQAETICFHATADDLDFDIADISVNYGTYDAASDKVCFYADTTGVYTLILTAVDTCGAADSDTTIVSVTVNEAPVVDLGDDFSVYLCAETEVCLDAVITDDNIETVYMNFGNYDPQTGQVCFTADTTGSYVIAVLAIDDCGETASDTVVVTVAIGEPLFVDLGEDFDIALCEPTEICVDVETIEVYKSLSTNLGVYNEDTRQVCFVPDTSGVYTLIVEVTDSCDLVASDTVDITVSLNSPPIVSGMTDTALYLCYPQQVCLPVNVFDPDGDIESISVNYNGQYEDGLVCFVPYDSGHYELIVTAMDSCGHVAADTAMVVIETDQGISIECPNDTTIFTCQLVDTFCLPIFGIPENAEVEVLGINTWYDARTETICFWSECSNTNHITVDVSTPCNTYSCEFFVTIACNTDPLVILPPDTTIASCEMEEICLPVGASDAEGNLADVIVEGALYNPITSQVCFTPDTLGTYVIRVTAVDSCEASDWDEIAVNVVLNSAPYITYVLEDSVFSQCALEEICLPVDIGDVDGNLTDVTTSLGFYDAEADQVCFTPDSAGRFCIEIIATDACGLADTAEPCIIVETGDYVQIDCPVTFKPIDIFLCEPGEACWPLNIIGDSFQVETSYGTWANGELCFYADTSGYYGIEVIAVAECNSDTCYIDFDVWISEEVDISCPADTSVVLCEPDTLCRQYTVLSNVDSVTVTAPAFLSGEEVCVPLLQPDDYVITMTAYGECGTAACTFTVIARFNSPPVVDAGNDTTLVQCEPSEICLPFVVSDLDTNIVEIVSSIGVVQGNQVCFTPEDFGIYDIVITAIDECGASGSDTVVVTVNVGGTVAIICPEGLQSDTICGPDTVRVVALITPEDAEVTVLPNGYYDPATGEVCVGIDTGGTYDITVIAEALCGSDTCEFTLEVELAQPPDVTCPALIDTLLCLAKPVTLCYPVTVSGSVSQIDVSPIGYYSDGFVCFQVDENSTYEIDVIAQGVCGADTCHTTVDVTQDQAPALFLPGYQTFERCLDDTDQVCVDGIYATDIESSVSLSMTCGTGDFTLLADDSGLICFLPDSFGVYEFCFEAFDSCNTTTGSFFVEITERENCDVCLRLSIDGGECIPVGMVQDVDMRIESWDPIGGFDILTSYDASVMTFRTATITGTQIDGWEYFTFRFGTGDCGDHCPSGLMRFVGLADMNDGAHHPPDSTLMPNGVLIAMQYQVANNQNLGGFFLPISFVWYNCGDNAFSSPSGDDLYIDLRIYNAETTLVWDEADDITYPESARTYGLGAPDTCVEGGGEGKPAPIRCVEFINGGICVIPAESIDIRGDINLNGIQYEIADAVVFTNYFIYGFSAFKINVAGQTAATDVNADGLTLSIGDLVYLIRIIIGDADPMPKTTPHSEKLTVRTEHNSDAIFISTEAASTIGAALLVYDIGGGLVLDEPRLVSDADGMDLMYGMENNELRLLIYNIGTNVIPTGRNNLVGIPCHGDGRLSLIRTEIVDYQGRPYTVVGKESGLPTRFALNQNYPNPFNPMTTISFTLPQPNEWKLEIFNITGRLVREFHASSDAGVVTVEWDGRTVNGLPAASGVYLYRLEAADFTATKKMVLLK